MVAHVYADPARETQSGTRYYKVGTSRSSGRSSPGSQNPRDLDLGETPYAATMMPKEFERFLKSFFASRRLRGSRSCFYVDPGEMTFAFLQAELYCRDLHLPQERLDALKAIRVKSVMLPASPEDERAYRELLIVQEQIKRLELQEERLKRRLMARIGDCAGIEGFVTWKAQERQVLDGKQIKIDFPQLHADYSSAIVTRYFCLL